MLRDRFESICDQFAYRALDHLAQCAIAFLATRYRVLAVEERREVWKSNKSAMKIEPSQYPIRKNMFVVEWNAPSTFATNEAVSTHANVASQAINAEIENFTSCVDK